MTSTNRTLANHTLANRTLALIAAAASRSPVLVLDASRTAGAPRDLSGVSGLSFTGPSSVTYDNVACWDLSDNHAEPVVLKATGGELSSRYFGWWGDSWYWGDTTGTTGYFPWSWCTDGNRDTFCHTWYQYEPWIEIKFGRAVVDRVEVRRASTAHDPRSRREALLPAT